MTTSKLRRRSGSSSILLCIAAFQVVAASTKVAVIGGGLSGSFFTRYLADYDTDCQVDSITILEPLPATRPVVNNALNKNITQGSRVATLQLESGVTVELGAAVAFEDFQLVLDVVRASHLEIGTPFNSSLGSGVGIYDGNGHWPLLSSTSSRKNLLLLARYNLDLLYLSRWCRQYRHKFAQIYHLLASRDPSTFYSSPSEVWQAVGFGDAIHVSFDELLDFLGFSRELAWWRRPLPYQGSLRSELLTAINLVNYNQDNSQVNALVGMGSFALLQSPTFSVVGGNYQIIKAALEQATQMREKWCGRRETAKLVEKRVTTVIGSLKGFTIYAGDELLGDDFDILILAAPLQQSNIRFLIQSHMDDTVLQDMPMAGLVDAHGTFTEDGHEVLPSSLPDSARRPYKAVVTTIVSNATIQVDYLGLASVVPRSIAMTARGKALLHNVTSIGQVAAGVYKVYSEEPLTPDTLQSIFGLHCKTEYVKVWGGRLGGATPDYQGRGLSASFLLFDGAVGFEGETSSGALYYPSAMEQSSLASMELAAVGALAVAKLVAQRLGLIQVQDDADQQHGDEL